ncbi:hypothetical protein B9J07_27680 [Sinorhizobium sp. LM21]|nr:hypothetical protein pLM21S1_p105 [Sinorhizobium sp. LM21]OWZ90372.1 hypothetical protein B9J07_27680 [Sinorhizobium sp. LM21]
MQVWVGNRRVGEANVSPRPGQREIVVQTAASLPLSRRYDMDDISPAVEVRKLVLNVVKRRFEIDGFAERISGPEYIAQVFNHHGVLPSEAMSSIGRSGTQRSSPTRSFRSRRTSSRRSLISTGSGRLRPASAIRTTSGFVARR